MSIFGWLDRLIQRKGRRESRQGQRWTGELGVPSSDLDSEEAASLASTENFSGLIFSTDEPAITEEELSNLDQREREMLRSIIELDYTTVREVMVPRLDMVAIDANATLQEATATIVEHNHSRLPVYVDTIDEVLGILYVRDLLAAVADPQNDSDVRSLTRPAFIVPETKRVDELLDEFRQRRIQIAIVVDEYGGTEGLVTMEDVLEEIVGEIEDEFSRGLEAEITRGEDGELYVSGGLSAEQIEVIFGVSIESKEFDTVGGFVYHQLGRVPHIGDVVHREGLTFEVASVVGRRLRTLKITKENGGSTDTPG